MAYAEEIYHDRLETRSRKSVRHSRADDERWPLRPLAAGGLNVRGNTRFLDQTGAEIIGLAPPVGTMSTGPA